MGTLAVKAGGSVYRAVLGVLTVVLFLLGLTGIVNGVLDWVNRPPAGVGASVDVMIDQWNGPSGIRLPAELTVPALTDARMPAGVSVHPANPVPASVAVEHPRYAALLLRSTGEVVGDVADGLIALVVALLLWDIREGRPFSRSNTARLGLVAVLVYLGQAGRSALEAAAARQLIADSGLPSDLLHPVDQAHWVSPIGGALMVLLLGAVFRWGAKLTDDVDGLV